MSTRRSLLRPLATATTLSRWGVALAATDEGLLVSGLAGVIHGILRQGHLLAAIVRHGDDLFRIAQATEHAPRRSAG